MWKPPRAIRRHGFPPRRPDEREDVLFRIGFMGRPIGATPLRYDLHRRRTDAAAALAALAALALVIPPVDDEPPTRDDDTEPDPLLPQLIADLVLAPVGPPRSGWD